MKTTKICVFLGVLVAGLICDRAHIQAQPSSGPVSNENGSASPDDAPASPEDDPASDDESIVVDDADSPWSQGVSAEDLRAARDLFREGNRLYLIPLYAKAVEQYIAALRKWKHPGIFYNLALAQLSLGKETEARENLEHALTHGEKPLGAKRFQNAQKQLAEVKRRLGRIRVTCRTPGAEVTLDGVTLFIGPGSYDGWVKAKSHELTAKKAGYLSEAKRVMVSSEKLQEIELKLVTLSEAADASRRWATWKPWAVVAAGGAVTLAGGVFNRLAAGDFRSYDRHFSDLSCAEEYPFACADTDSGLQGLKPKLVRARREQAIAVGGYIVGGSLLAAGVALLYLNLPRSVERDVSSASNRSVAVTPCVFGDMLGVAVRAAY